MSLQTVKKEIDRFLGSEVPEVLVIKGAWGVGKTFLWNKLLKFAQSEDRIALNRYSYVSLFGINSLESFKFSIFEHQINKKLIGVEPSLETFKENTTSVLASLGKKSVRLFQGLTFMRNFNPALESLSYLSLNKTLICVDDFERKGGNLSPKDILGLISALKEQKACKVAMILNDLSFEEEALKEYEKYKEKVVDIELLFNPSPEECVDIAFEQNDTYSEKLKEFIKLPKINNIRIIKKIERLSHLLIDALSKYEDEVLYQSLHSLVLFSWSYYVKGEEVPSVEYIKTIGYKMFGLDKKEVTEQEKLWQTILTEYNYQTTDEFDLAILKIVETGFVDAQELEKEAEKLNQQVVAAKSDSSFGEAWNLYHDSFDNNEDEVIQGIYQSFKRNTKYISPMNLDGTVRLFRDLGKDELANEIIEHYINIRKDHKKLFDLDEYPFANDIKDTEIIEKFSKINEESKTPKKIKEALENIVGKNSWSGEDADALANASVDEYFKLFKSTRGRHLSSWVNTCLKFGRFANASERDKQIAERAAKALQRIGEESAINARRVAKFGITIDDTESN